MVLVTNSLYAQKSTNKTIDSLIVSLKKNQTDTSKIETYNSIIESYERTDLNKAIPYIKSLYILVKKSNSTIGYGHYYKAYAQYYMFKENYKNAEIFAQKAKNQYDQIKKADLFLESVYIEAFAIKFQNNPVKAVKIIQNGLKKFSNSNCNAQKGDLYFLMGFIYSRTNEDNKALKNLKTAVNFMKPSNNKVGIINSYSEISYIYLKTKQFNNALVYVNNALDINDDNVLTKSNLLSLKGNIFFELKKYDEALKFVLKSQSVLKNLNEKTTTTDNYLIIANIYYETKKYEEAIKYGLKVVNLNELYIYNIQANTVIAKSYFAQKQYEKALTYNQVAANTIEINKKEFQIKQTFREVYKQLAENLFALKKSDLAYTYQNLYIALERESLLAEKKDRINELQTKFNVSDLESNLKDKVIAIKKNEIEIQHKNSIIKLASIIGVSIGIMIIIIFFFYNKIKEKNKLITAQNYELETSKVIISNSLRHKETLLKEIHHRVKNNLQMVLSMLNIQARRKNFNSVEEFLEKGETRIITMALIHQSLYENEDLDKVDFNLYIKTLLHSIVETLGLEDQNIQFNFQIIDIKLNIQTAIPLGLIINEIITNMLKYAFPNNCDGNINISITKNTNTVFNLTITNDGPPFENATTRKKSLGLELIKLLAQQLNGDFKLQSDTPVTYSINFQEIFE